MEYEIGEDQSASVAVVKAVSEFEDCSPNSLPPLHETIDTDCLDGLYSARPNGTHRSGGCVSFVFSDSQVRVDNGEYITVHDTTIIQ
ncbi:HalOD1 output domain-containing protein [Haladaptatus halobius]|uniref:HalOD1 output domain-containing protein n=1 Tax=Haladaptatus halobius TaxID=2884875 RepID=UPI001D0A3862|nr:HalOD1 output domain-containing protein [Haladaptatus halobius]